MNRWHIITCEYPPAIGGVSDYTHQVAEALTGAGDEVHVWCPGRGGRVARRDNAVRVHDDLGGIGPRDLQHLDRSLAEFPSPRRLLVQWVPHGFGYHSMNMWFCLWLARRAWLGDQVELMVHEPYLEFRGALRHRLMAGVHRVMTVVLLAASSRVWMSIPAWERCLRPYALGRPVSMQWLPIPGCVVHSESTRADALRSGYARPEQSLVGHFGSFGSAITGLLEDRLPTIMDSGADPAMLLIGSGSEEFRRTLIEHHPGWSGRIHATGYVDSARLAAHFEICDLFVQPYPDGITSRRTSAMSCLAHGRPVVATSGHLTEPLWAESSAVRLAAVDDVAAFTTAAVGLLADADERRALGARGQRLYHERFSTERVIELLRAA